MPIYLLIWANCCQIDNYNDVNRNSNCTNANKIDSFPIAIHNKYNNEKYNGSQNYC